MMPYLNQERASRRKKDNQRRRTEADQLEASAKGITVFQLEVQRARQRKTVLAQQERKQRAVWEGALQRPSYR